MYDAPFIYKFKTHYNVTLGAIEEFFFTVFVLHGTDLHSRIRANVLLFDAVVFHSYLKYFFMINKNNVLLDATVFQSYLTYFFTINKNN